MAEDIERLAGYQEDSAKQLEQISDTLANGIWVRDASPNLGANASRRVPKLSTADELVLFSACSCSLKSDDVFIMTTDLAQEMGAQALSEKEFWDSVEFLAHLGLIGNVAMLSATLALFKITPQGFEYYGSQNIDGFDVILRDALLYLARFPWEDEEDRPSNQSISTGLGIPISLTNCVLDILTARGWIRTVAFLGGQTEVTQVTVVGKRAAQLMKVGEG